MDDAGRLTLDGAFLVYVLFDVGEGIKLDPRPVREPKFRQPAPSYVRFEHPPAVESAPDVQLPSGERFQAPVKYFN